jgi:hypothetical protein
MIKENNTKSNINFHNMIFTKYNTKENAYQKINAMLRNDSSFVDEKWKICLNLNIKERN